MNNIKKISFIVIAAIMCGCPEFEEKQYSEVPFINVTSAELFIGDGVPEGRGSIQLTSSPEGTQYTWTSLQPSVATVSQTGLVTAVSEGFSEITVASGSHVASVNVRVREWVPLEGFTLGNLRRYVAWGERFQIFVTPIPPNASEVNINWESSDPSVASILDNGWVTYWGDEGEFVTITATVEGIEQQSTTFSRRVTPVRLDRSKWVFPGYVDNSQAGQIGYSSQANNEGSTPNGRVIAMLDGATNTFWHSRWGANAGDGLGGTNYPQWFIVSLNELTEIHAVMFQRRQGNGGSARGYFLYTCETEPTDPNDPVNGYDWKFVGEYEFNPNINDEQLAYIDDEEEPLPKARYVRLYFDEKHRGSGNFVMMAEFALFGRYLEE